MKISQYLAKLWTRV